LDLGHILAGLAILAWLLRLRDPDLGPASPATRECRRRHCRRDGIRLLNGIPAAHDPSLAGIPFQFDALADSLLVQAALSLFWTILAFALMLFARLASNASPGWSGPR